MKTKIKILQAFVLITLFTISCKEDSTNYSVKDLEGVWTSDITMVFHGGDLDGRDTLLTNNFTFNADGTLASIEDHPVFLSNVGRLSVSSEGNITGIITTTHDTYPGIETTQENWTGCVFETESKILVSMRWDWTNTRPGSGYYIITGEMIKE